MITHKQKIKFGSRPSYQDIIISYLTNSQDVGIHMWRNATNSNILKNKRIEAYTRQYAMFSSSICINLFENKLNNT